MQRTATCRRVRPAGEIETEAGVAVGVDGRVVGAAGGLPCEVLVDGPTIEVGESDYEPDVIVRCGSDALSGDNLAVPDAMVVVEVLSPTTRRVDVSRKLVDYFQLPSAQHYMIVFSDRVRAVHHRRAGEQIETRIVAEGDVTLDPPGITVALTTFYPGGEAVR